jgi:hypothetical protein
MEVRACDEWGGGGAALRRSQLYIDTKVTVYYRGHRGDDGGIQNCQSYCLKVTIWEMDE